MGYWEQIAADRMRREMSLRGAPWWRRFDWWSVIMIMLGIAWWGGAIWLVGKALWWW